MSDDTITEDQVRAIVESLADCPPGNGDPLDLDSLTLVQLVEELEMRFDLRVRPTQVTAEHFGTIAAVTAFVRTARS